MNYWTKFALVATGVLGVGYVVKKAGAKSALKQKIDDHALVPGQTITANLPTGSYTLDPSIIQPPADLPNGKVQLKFVVGEMDTTGKITRVHGMYTPPSGVNVNLGFDPKQLVA